MTTHLDDVQLMLLIDGELSPAETAAAAEHLGVCEPCRSRRDKLSNAADGFDRLYRESFQPPPGAAARLRSGLANAATRRQPRRGSWALRSAAIAAGAVFAVFSVATLWGPPATAGSLPDSRLTPGATAHVSRDQVCGQPAEDSRPVSADLAERVFRGYRISPRPRAYEVDYLISPALGGADDIRNLWPQPYSEGEWTSRVKDALEDHLRGLVCSGSLDLAEAQREIASDWIAAYRKYFRTQRPLATHASFVKDQPWE